VFNFSGSEIVFLLLLALIILGPEKLPEAVRKFGKTYAEFKKVTTGFQTELKSALDEPMREMKETADALRKAAQFDIDLDPKSMFSSDSTAAPATTPSASEILSSNAMAGLTPAADTAAAEPAPAESSATDAAATEAGATEPAAIVRPAGPSFGSAAPPRVIADNEPPLVPGVRTSATPAPDVEDGAESA
jgi:sec-independent protein translocase protein TatB